MWRNLMKLTLTALVLTALVGLPGTDLSAQDVRTIEIRAWTVGPDDPSITRKFQLDIAADRLNAALEFARTLGNKVYDVVDAETADVLKNLSQTISDYPNIRVSFSSEFDTTTWNNYKQRNLLALQTRDPNEIADIIVTGHEMVGPHSAAGYIEPLDDFIAKYPKTYGDFIQSLFEATRAAGHVYAVPQDTEARLVWYRKDMLKAAGLSDEEINSLPERVAKGEFTLADLADLGQKLVNAGVVEKNFAIWHRPTPGTDWFQFQFAFGGEIFDPDSGKLVLDKAATLKMLEYIDRLVNRDHLTDKGIASAGWDGIWKNWFEGKFAIFMTGGSWHWAEWKRKTAEGKGWAGLSSAEAAEQFQFDNIIFTAIPSGVKGGKPVSVSHPIVTLLSAVSPPEKKELAFAIVTLAQAPDLANLHALGSGHLPIRQAQLATPAIQQDRFIQDVSGLLQYSRFAPNHNSAPVYWEELFNAVQAVEVGGLSPQQALDNLEQALRQRVGDDQLIVR